MCQELLQVIFKAEAQGHTMEFDWQGRNLTVSSTAALGRPRILYELKNYLALREFVEFLRSVGVVLTPTNNPVVEGYVLHKGKGSKFIYFGEEK